MYSLTVVHDASKMMTMSLQTISSNLATVVLDKVTNPAYLTQLGKCVCGDSISVLALVPDATIDLVVTSPPFALQRKKEYGNKKQDEYVGWLTQFAHLIHRKLKPSGSFVLDLGGAYRKGVPVRSLYNYRVLIEFCDNVGFFLAEEFFWHNPSKLPSPIEWVNKRKIRAKDSVNTVWWFSKSEWPKADVRNVLAPYSERMKKLIRNPRKYYTPKERPSGHDIGAGFGTDNGGAIPSNLLQIPNSESNSAYLRRCKAVGAKGHPARFPLELPSFFIKFLTEPGDIVVDVFSGSNTTGQAAEKLERQWLSIDLDTTYVATSAFRFVNDDLNDSFVREIFDAIVAGEMVNLTNYRSQLDLL